MSGLHPWPRTVPAARALQERLRGGVELTPPFRLKRGMLIAGVDVSYERKAVDCHAVISVLRWPGWEPMESVGATLPSPFPYVPGLLSFREGPMVVKALRELRCAPDLFLVDSHGTAHPRRFGSACHLGLWFNAPTIGCAKSRLCGEETDPGHEAGEATALRDGRETIGWVLRSRAGVKPIYVSPGHRISMRSALTTARRLCGPWRVVEPIRAAHKASNRLRRGESLTG